MGEIFHFKQFSINQAGCGMKINTDGVLLGALEHQNSLKKSILDIGTGTGVIALMLAQLYENAEIDAVEIDPQAAEVASENALGSKFSKRIHIYPQSFESLSSDYHGKKYDLIVTNPPFFINSLKSAAPKQIVAKHTDEGFFESLLTFINDHLLPGGALHIILPLNTSRLFQNLVLATELRLAVQIHIKSFESSDPHREILIFHKKSIDIVLQKTFVIYRTEKIYSEEFTQSLTDFFIIF